MAGRMEGEIVRSGHDPQASYPTLTRQMQPLAPHHQLLVASVASWLKIPSAPHLDALLSEQEIDWAVALTQSMRHGVAPFLARQLHPLASHPQLPENVTACLERMLAANGRRNAALFRQANHLQTALEQAKIPCIALKGIGLALSVYSEPALRSLADIDLLVEPAQFEAACAVARANGYQSEDAVVDAHEHHARYVLTGAEDILTDTLPYEFDPALTPELLADYARRTRVEIHRGLFRDVNGATRAVETALLWEGTQTVALPEGGELRLLSPEMTLVYLASHAAAHCFERLLFPVDMACVLALYGAQLDWKRVVWLAERFQARRHLWMLLDFVRNAFELEVPAEPLRRLAHDRETQFAAMRLTLADIFAAEHLDDTARTIRRWQLTQDSRERLTNFWGVLYPPYTVMAQRYGVRSRMLLSVFYLLRPLELLGQGARRLWRRYGAARRE